MPKKIKKMTLRKKAVYTAAVAAGVIIGVKAVALGGNKTHSESGNNDNSVKNLKSEVVVEANQNNNIQKNYNAFADGAEVTVGQLMRTDKSKLSQEHRAIAKIISLVHSVPSGKDAVEQAVKNNVTIAFNNEINHAAQYTPSDNKIEFGTKILAKMSNDPATEGLAIYSLREELAHAAHNKDSLMVHVYLNEGKEFKKFSYLPPEAAVHVNRHEEASAKVPAFMVLEELSHTPNGKKITDAVVAENPGNIYISRFYQDYSSTLNGRADIASKIEAASVLYMHIMGDAQFIGNIDAGYISLPDNQLWQYPDSTGFKAPTGDRLAEWGKISIKGQEYNFLDNLAPGLNDPYYRNYPGRTVEFIERKSESLGLEAPEFRVRTDSEGRLRFMVNVADTASFERDTATVPPAGHASLITRPANDSDIIKPVQVNPAKKTVSSATPAPVYE